MNNEQITYPSFKVCVQCYTYNHSKYIIDTMSGFSIQRTDFPFVCCIVDDASTDGTQDVIREYINSNFDRPTKSCHFVEETDYARITYVQHKTNRNCYFVVLFLKENHYRFRRSKQQYLNEWQSVSDFVALCEGDDYWFDEMKLWKQVDLLQNNLACGMCYSKVKVYDQTKHKFKKKEFGGPYVTFSELLSNNVIPTLSAVMSRGEYDAYLNIVNPDEKNWEMTDYPLWLWFSHESKVLFLNECTGVYRVLNSSASHKTDNNSFYSFVKSTYEIRKYFCHLFEFPEYIAEDQLSNDMFRAAVMYGDYKMERKYFRLIKAPTMKQRIKHFLCKNSFIYNTVGKILITAR